MFITLIHCTRKESACRIRDAVERVHDGGIGPLPFHKGNNRAEVRFYKSITYNFVVYQNGIETSFLQSFAHPETSKWFSIISGVIIMCVLCQQISQNRCFGNVNMTSYRDVTNIVCSVTMTNVRHCSKLEFCRGIHSSNRPGITRPLHATE